MPAARKPAARGATPSKVDDFVAALEHPLKPQIEDLRRLMAVTDPAITEEIKWNSVTFRTTESFATVHLRSTDRLQLVFHLGAKPRKPVPDMKLDDPVGLVRWLAPDRCLVSLPARKLKAAEEKTLQGVVRQWLSYL